MHEPQQTNNAIGRLAARWRARPLAGTLVLLALLALALILIETVRLGNTGFGDKSLWDWLELLLVPLALALGGSIFALRLTRAVEEQRERNALTVDIYQKHLDRYREYARVQALLTAQESELGSNDRNDLREFGNWLDLVATLANQGLLNGRLLAEWQLDGALCDFYARTQAYTFLQQAYAGSWRNLRRYCEGRTTDGPGV